MPNVMINCPILKVAVPTGLTTEAILFQSLPTELEIPLRCPACKKLHKWKPRHAWIEGQTR
jgi:hypothetical protein